MILEIRNMVTEINAFDGLIYLQTKNLRVKGYINGNPEDQRAKRTKTKKNRIFKECGTTTEDVTYVQWV